jgi:Glu-tRNA(Gln) amidotransferase subunit E-like FAD-binding protein
VGIQTVVLEEDSARRTSETSESVTFRLDRLGIPLVEIATDPDCKNPEQVQEVAEKIGLLLRATGKVMRGLGTIRQDVNVSIKGHPRVEIKGVQDLRNMPQIVELEVKRQQEELKSKKKVEGHVRNVLPDLTTKFLRPMPGAARMYPETDLPYYYLDRSQIAKLELAETPEEIKRNLEKLDLSQDLVSQLSTSEDLPVFRKFHERFPKLNANLIATTIIVTPKEVRRKLQKPDFELSDEILDCVFTGLSGGSARCPSIVKESVQPIIESLAKEKPGSLEALYVIMSRHKVLSDKELAQEIQKIKKEFKGPKEKLVGIVMGRLRGKADPQKIIKLLK